MLRLPLVRTQLQALFLFVSLLEFLPQPGDLLQCRLFLPQDVVIVFAFRFGAIQLSSQLLNFVILPVLLKRLVLRGRYVGLSYCLQSILSYHFPLHTHGVAGIVNSVRKVIAILIGGSFS